MTNESTLLLAVWELIPERLSAADRMDSAIHLLRAFADFGIDPHDLYPALDEDDTIQRAFDVVFEEDCVNDDDTFHGDDE